MLTCMHRYCGKAWSEEDIGRIRALLEQEPQANRARLSRRVCELFEWRSANGRLKEMSCRVAMLKMHRDGLIDLPAPRWARPRSYQVVATPAGDPQPEWGGTVSDLGQLEVVPVARGAPLRLWNEVVARHHYLGYKMLPGAQLRYFIRDGERLLGGDGLWGLGLEGGAAGYLHWLEPRGASAGAAFNRRSVTISDSALDSLSQLGFQEFGDRGETFA